MNRRDVVRVGVCHLGAAANPVADLHTLTDGADLLALTGAGAHRDQVREFLVTHRRWAGYLGDDTAGAAETPLLWDTAALRRRGTRTSEAVVERYVGSAGAGPAQVPRKVNNLVRLTHLGTGRRVNAIPVHTVAAADHIGLPLLEQDHRRQHYAVHIRSLVDQTRFRLGATFLAGDFGGVAYDFDLLDPLHRAGFLCDPGSGEGGHIWHRGDAHPLTVVTVPGSSPRPSVVVIYAL